MPRLKDKYLSDIVPSLREEFNYSNVHQVPRVEKIVVNMGVGEAIQNPKILDTAMDELATLAGQRPVLRRAKKSVAAFKLREGQPVGCTVTLRCDRMWEFLDRLVSIALPRVRDFRGVSPKAFDGRGNYTMGVREQIIFPEIEYDKVDRVTGMNITICTTAKTDGEGFSLLKQLGVPFRS